MIRFSDDDEEYLDRIRTPPETPPVSDEDSDEKTKTLWYHDKSSHDHSVSITLCRPHGKNCYLAGETIEVDVVCTVRQLQLLSGVLEGFCVANGQVEETFVFQEIRLFPNQQHQEPPSHHQSNNSNRKSVNLETKGGGHQKLERNRKNSSSSSNNLSYNNNNGERQFKFWLTIPSSAPPSLKVNSKTGIFYRVRVCGMGEVHHYHVLPHHHYHGILTPTREASSPHIGGLGNYIPFKVRNNTCAYVNKYMLCEKPQTSFSITCPVAGKEIALKVHLVGAAPYSVLGQLCTFFVKVENSTHKCTKGFTIKVVRHVHTIATSSAFIRGTDEEDPSIEKCKTLVKYKFHSAEYHCYAQGKLQSQLAVLIPHTLTPTIATQNLHATYGLLVRVDVTPTHGLAQEMPILLLPCALDEATRKNVVLDSV